MPQIADVFPGCKRRVWRSCAVLLLVCAIVVAAPAQAEKGKPLSANDVMDLLKGSVENSEIARIVQENGISFRMTDELESQFRSAGAKDELIEILKKASKPDEPPPAPTGTLLVQSQPGEAQVYVNDEPRGTTSSAGELRLAGLAPGTYRLRLTLEGYKTWENSMAVTAGGSVTAFVTLEKQNLAPTVTLDADRNSIQSGQDVYLRWTSVHATDVDIEPGVGKVSLAGSTSVSPRESTTYTLTAIGPGGIKTATAFIAVSTPPPAPVAQVRPVVGNLPGFPVPGASFKELRFFEGPYNPPALGSRTYAVQFNHRLSRYIHWELRLTCPAPTYRINFTINATWYSPTGAVFGNDVMNAYADVGWTEPVYNTGRGWARTGMWKRGVYRVDIFVNGSRIASGSFSMN